MPIVLLIAVSVFGLFTCTMVGGSLEDIPTIIRIVIISLFIVFLIGPFIWMGIAWEQDELPSEYLFVDIQRYPSGHTVYTVHPENAITGIQIRCNIALPPETIIRVWQYNKWKNGINWMNDGMNRTEIITPSDIRYQTVKDKAKYRTMRIIEKK